MTRAECSRAGPSWSLRLPWWLPTAARVMSWARTARRRGCNVGIGFGRCAAVVCLAEEAALIEALAAGRMAAVARGEIGRRAAGPCSGRRLCRYRAPWAFLRRARQRADSE